MTRRRDESLFDANEDYGKYSDADWRQIKKSLAGIDLDATVVKDQYLNTEMPLREVLQGVASYYAARSCLKPVMRSERADWLRKAQASFELARANLGAVFSGVDPDDFDQLRHTATAYHAADAVLKDAIASTQRQLGKLVAMGSTSSKNAEKPHQKFWDELRVLWLALPIAPEQRTHENLRAFLHTCSVSIFPATTTPGALTAFTKDHYKPRQFRKRASR